MLKPDYLVLLEKKEKVEEPKQQEAIKYYLISNLLNFIIHY